MRRCAGEAIRSGGAVAVEQVPQITVATSATVGYMARAVSIRELRNSTSAVVSELEAGEQLTLTVNRRPVADILPHTEERDPWVPAAELRRIVSEAPADRGLFDDLAEIRNAELDDA
jgi:antitoxin (DNA-binding transcriptional repressor) of toxin-antitoxin stability system